MNSSSASLMKSPLGSFCGSVSFILSITLSNLLFSSLGHG